MSTLTNNHTGGLRTCWQPLRWQPTTLATTTEKTTLVPLETTERSRTSHRDIRLATSVTGKLLRTRWKQQKNNKNRCQLRKTSKTTESVEDGQKPPPIFREQQKQRSTKLGCVQIWISGQIYVYMLDSQHQQQQLKPPMMAMKQEVEKNNNNQQQQ